MQAKKKLYDPSLKLIKDAQISNGALVLSAIMHNEMDFLPHFLEHYRAIGVEHFVFVDDRSSDGSFEYAADQADVSIAASDYRFGDPMKAPNGKTKRAMLAWRQTVVDKFVPYGKWSVHLDLDEFIYLPKGKRLQDYIPSAPRFNTVYGAMVDLYPKNWADILEGDPTIHDVEWYFDARPMFKLGHKGRPLLIYSGARARLRETYWRRPTNEPFRLKLQRKLRGNPYVRMGMQHKPVLLKSGDSRRFKSPHYVSDSYAPNLMFPMAHYKFAPNWAKKLQFALTEKSHHDNSHGYFELAEVTQAMQNQNADFLCEWSQRFEGFEDFKKAGIAIGFDDN